MSELKSSIFKNIRVYWLAFIVYFGIILFGYDTGIAGGVVAAAYFQRRFGLLNSDGTANANRTKSISANVVSVLQAGAFFGALGSAPISGKIGRKPTLIAFTAIFLVGAILTTVPDGNHGLSEIYAGRVISGLGIGGISAIAPAFVSECSPRDVRGRITGLFQIFVATGVMISYFVNFGVNEHPSVRNSPKVWRIPFGLQLLPAGVLAFGLLTIKESPRYLASVGRSKDALENLAYLRKEPITSDAVLSELAEIEAAIEEERVARSDLGIKEAFLGKGNFVRFFIAFVIFMLQQWSGQNSVNYYAPQFFAALGYVGSKQSLLAAGVYGVIKTAATALFIFFGIESLGRTRSLFISSMGMGILFFIIGAIGQTHPPPHAPPAGAPVPKASQAMAAMLYLYVCFYSMGMGPIPWIYCSDIFPTRTRHYGLALASASQWLFNFSVSQATPSLEAALNFRLFFFFGALNIGGMAMFALWLPETKGRSLEEMDIIFGSVTKEKREADIAIQRQLEMNKTQTQGEASSDHKETDSEEKV